MATPGLDQPRRLVPAKRHPQKSVRVPLGCHPDGVRQGGGKLHTSIAVCYVQFGAPQAPPPGPTPPSPQIPEEDRQALQ